MIFKYHTRYLKSCVSNRKMSAFTIQAISKRQNRIQFREATIIRRSSFFILFWREILHTLFFSNLIYLKSSIQPSNFFPCIICLSKLRVEIQAYCCSASADDTLAAVSPVILLLPCFHRKKTFPKQSNLNALAGSE